MKAEETIKEVKKEILTPNKAPKAILVNVTFLKDYPESGKKKGDEVLMPKGLVDMLVDAKIIKEK
jgi:hypothetical protein